MTKEEKVVYIKKQKKFYKDLGLSKIDNYILILMKDYNMIEGLPFDDKKEHWRNYLRKTIDGFQSAKLALKTKDDSKFIYANDSETMFQDPYLLLVKDMAYIIGRHLHDLYSNNKYRINEMDDLLYQASEIHRSENLYRNNYPGED